MSGIHGDDGFGWMAGDGCDYAIIRTDLLRDESFSATLALERASEYRERYYESATGYDAALRPKREKPRRPHCVYRFFDHQGALLYVGKAVNPDSRQRQHERRAWWPDVRHITREWYDSDDDARRAEDLAIRDEGPLYNRIGGGAK